MSILLSDNNKQSFTFKGYHIYHDNNNNNNNDNANNNNSSNNNNDNNNDNDNNNYPWNAYGQRFRTYSCHPTIKGQYHRNMSRFFVNIVAVSLLVRKCHVYTFYVWRTDYNTGRLDFSQHLVQTLLLSATEQTTLPACTYQAHDNADWGGNTEGSVVAPLQKLTQGMQSSGLAQNTSLQCTSQTWDLRGIFNTNCKPIAFNNIVTLKCVKQGALTKKSFFVGKDRIFTLESPIQGNLITMGIWYIRKYSSDDTW